MKLTINLVFAFAGCLPGPDVGAPHQTPSDGSVSGCNADSDPNTEISYSSDLADGVFVRGRCISCHKPGGQGISQSELFMDTYEALRAGGRRSGANIVIAGAPCSSILSLKIGSSPPFGRRMPYNGPPYLSSSDIQLVHDWIAEGARDN